MKISYEGNGELLEFDECVHLAHRVIAQNVEDATRHAAGETGSGMSKSDGQSAVEWFTSDSKSIVGDREFWCMIAGEGWDQELLCERVISAMKNGEVIRISDYFTAVPEYDNERGD